MSWTCGVCTFENPSLKPVCDMCNEKRPGAPSSSSTTSTANDSWVCPTCTLSQNPAVTRCQMCDTPNPLSKLKPTPASTTTIHTGSGGPWTCVQCTFVNPRPSSSCEMCNARNGTASSQDGFGSQGFEDYDGDFGVEERPVGQNAGGGIAGLLAGLNMSGGGGANNPLDAMKKTMLDMILPALQGQLSQATIPPSEGKVDAGGVVGQVAYNVGEIKCSQCTLDPKHVQLTLDPQGRFQLVASEIALELAEFKWAYDKLNNLKFSSSGTAVCAVRGCSITVLIRLGPTMMPQVDEVKAVVKELDITIKKTKLKLLYELLIASFKGSIKAALQSALEKATLDAISDSTQALQ